MSLFGGRKASIDLSKKNGGVKVLDIVKNAATFILGILLMLTLVVAFHYYRENSKLRSLSTEKNITTGDPVTAAIIAVEKHILLPQGERPQVASVSNLTPLANIPFFGNALVGDEVLVYCKASLSILYSPSRDKVIEVSRQLVGGSCGR